MSAWSILTSNSTAGVGSTAWVHLNAQNTGGGGFPVQVVPVKTFELAIESGQANIGFSNATADLNVSTSGLTLGVSSHSLEMVLSNG